MKQLLTALSPDEPDWKIARQLDPTRLPAHIAIIMDGNGRWAKRRNYPRILGHKAGMGPVRTVVEACSQLGVEALTLYAFSVENWKRPKHEIEGVWRLLRIYLRRELPDLMKNGIRLVAIGRIEGLPANVQEDLQAVMRKTAGNRGMQLNLAINYSGRTELIDAVNALLENAKLNGSIDSLQVTEERIAKHLYTAGLKDPDLLIRTSGELRISNFLLWQIAYAEIYVTETLWPDFTRADLLKAIFDYQNRDRRFGGLTSGAPSRVPARFESFPTLIEQQQLETPVA